MQVQTGIQIHLANKSGHLAVHGNSQHRIYWEEYGSVNGKPVMFMHGGPRTGCHSSSARFFNPERYRVILFDQRGCGKSTPSASDDDATAALTDNTTPLSLPSDQRQTVFWRHPRAAAISGGIDQPTSHDRHQYPDLGSLER